jgi:hypothetical protein
MPLAGMHTISTQNLQMTHLPHMNVLETAKRISAYVRLHSSDIASKMTCEGNSFFKNCLYGENS